MTTTPRRGGQGRPPMNPIVPVPRFRSAAPNAGLLRTALWVSVLVAAARATALFGIGAVRSRPDLLSDRAVTALLEAADALTLVTLVAAAITWLLWVAWTSRLERNAASLGVGEGSVGPRGAVLWWLVPGFNLLVPFGQLLGLDRRLADGEQRSHDALIATWWVALLVAAAAVIATTAPLATSGTAGASPANLVNAGFASLTWIAAGLISLRVVRQVQRDEDRRTAVVSRGWRPGAPSWPVAPTAAPAAARVPVLPRYPTGFSPGVPTGPGSAPGSPRSAPGPGSAPTPTSVPGAAPSWSRRQTAARAPGWVVGVILVGGLIGLIVNAVGSSNGSRSTPPIPTSRPSLVLVTSQARPTATPAVRPTAQRPSPTAADRSPAAGSLPPGASGDPASANTALLLLHATDGDGSCTAIEPAAWPTGSLAAIACRPANPAVATLRYALYPSPDEAEATYVADLTASGVEAGTGDCFQAEPGESSFSLDRSPRGRVFCLLAASDGTPTLEWFDRTVSIVGWATGIGSELKLLSDWWIKNAGPI